jgi:hypothetical protein
LWQKMVNWLRNHSKSQKSNQRKEAGSWRIT